ncbi:MerR family transcriptional regulator [Arthrobacter sp. I2-34]|uniref:MerR family transcriptional regulator n=1 Tax=Arthrobacter hankyongi TaxID=2904801 RepID=A0ABS9L6X7_9MICC|nr:MerR family transcriptional regulator [Arthrobacter hankyongi]MCG2622400.1 MerR family transcriptional regulator [Arthrobacter hankyongi]
MDGNRNGTRRWSIGELARATGITVRTLHHYDAIGLLVAGERTAAGHRRYTEADVRRLYRIRSLQALGLSLAETAAVLTAPVEGLDSLEDLLATQLERLAAHAERLRQLQDRIEQLLGRIRSRTVPDAGQFLSTLEMISMFDGYFTPEQRSQLAARAAGLGPDAVEAAKASWAGLVQELLQHVRQQTPAADPGVQELVARWDALATRFNGGDDAVKATAQQVWQDQSETISRTMPWPADELRALVAYLHEARQVV